MAVNFNIRSILLTLVVFGLFVLALPISLWKGLLSVDQGIQILGLILTWPVAALIVALVFFSTFRGPINEFLRGIGRVNLGGVSIERQTPGDPEKEESDPKEDGLTLTPEQQQQLRAGIDDLLEKKNVSDKNAEKLRDELVTAYLIAYQWKFKFLEIHLVYNSKRILLWIAQEGSVALTHYHETWKAQIMDADERETILAVLLHNVLIEAVGADLKITNVGYAFLQHTGIVPVAPGGGTAYNH